MDDEGKTTEGKEELSAKNKDRRADNRKEQVRWGRGSEKKGEFLLRSVLSLSCPLPSSFSLLQNNIRTEK